MSLRLIASLALGAALCAGCGRESGPAGWVVATQHLGQWRLLDRDGDGAEDDPKPQAERDALLDRLATLQAHVLAVQDLGGEAEVAELLSALRSRGLDYPHAEWVTAGARGGHALLSRLPGTVFQVHTGMTYRIAEDEVRVDPAFIEARIPSPGGPSLRVFAAFLAPPEADLRSQDTYELRRNEARLLGQEVRRRALESPAEPLIVAGCLHDGPASAVLRTVASWKSDTPHAADSGARDAQGDGWTMAETATGSYHRRDYLLLNPAAAARVPLGGAVIHPAAGSPHRAVSVSLRSTP